MIDQLFMKDLARDIAPPLEPVEQPATLLAAGPATSDVGQVTVQGYKPGQDTAGGAFVGTRLNTPKAGQAQPTQQDREKLAIGLLDSLAGALRGAVAQTGGLPGDIRSIVDMIAQEGAEKYLGQRSFATTEELLKDTSMRIPGTQTDIPFPPVLGKGATNIAERQPTVEAAQEVGTFLPAPGIPEAVVQGAKLLTKAVKATKGLPVGMSTQAVGEGVDQLGFYSAAKQAVDAIQQPKGTGDQFLKQIEKTPGVKPDEIKWTGLDEFLKSKKSVTKAEVQEYLDKNRVEVKEVSLSDSGLKKKFSVNSPEDQDFYDVIDKQGKVVFTGPEDDADYLIDRSLTKFSKYTLPGGENYREVLLTLPSKQTGKSQIAFKTTEDADNFLTDMSISGFEDMNYGRLNDTNVVEFDGAIPSNVTQMIRNNDGDIIAGKEMAGSTYGSPHFDQPNILAHLRVNDRVDADGKKVLFVEEVQSDWHQAGRKKGYKGEALSAKEEQRYQELSEFGRKNLQGDELAEYDGLIAKRDAFNSSVPDAPFKTTWHELAMKRAIQMASEGGYDRIAFTTGKTQAERFDLSKQIESVQYKPSQDSKDGKFYVAAIDKQGNSHLGDWYTPDEIESNLGKEISKKIVDGSGNKISGTPEDSTMKELSGLDLQVGGEGMKGFYDDILPKFLNKYAKKWDAKAGMTEIPAFNARTGEKTEPVHYIDITPKMRESVMTKGQPMFAVGGASAGAAATQQEDNK